MPRRFSSWAASGYRRRRDPLDWRGRLDRGNRRIDVCVGLDRAVRLAALCFCLAVSPAAVPLANAQQAVATFREIIAPLGDGRGLTYFIAGTGTSVPSGDAELCTWALDDWVRHAEGRLDVAPAAEADALIRVYLVAPGFGRYGEMRPIMVGDRRGAEVYVRTETDTLTDGSGEAARSDPLMRETIVYLTCLHEIGHALGMVHTDVFADVMYYFGYGGDIPAFFNRYRSRLETRADIAGVSGLSAGDIDQLLAAYPVD
jgi:hypothetical protein